jgi:hypothetical protein
MKAKLDALFSKTRVVKSKKTLKAAGFKKLSPQPVTQIVVSKHPKLKGYFIKLYTDDKKVPEWQRFLWRVIGAERIRKKIEEHHATHLFKVPKKWIYPLPSAPQSTGKYPKSFILIAEDMRLLKEEDNFFRWKSIAMTTEKLTILAAIVGELGLEDSLSPKNTCFAKDGKIAFVDTEIFDHTPVYWKRPLSFLSPSKRALWEKLTRNGKFTVH